MSPELHTRLNDMAAELERGQADQPLVEFLAALAAEFRGATRAILVPLPGTAARPWLPAGEGGVGRLTVPGARWDWLVVTDPAAALAEPLGWNRLAGFSPLVVVVGEGGAGALPAAAYDLLNAFAGIRKRGVTLMAGPGAAPTGLPGAFLPVLPVAAFDPAGDWTSALKAVPPDFSEQLRLWLEGFAAERAALPLAARIEQMRLRAQAQKNFLDQRQAAMLSQRDAGAGRARLDRAKEACLQVFDAMDKELAEESRLFLAAKGEGPTRLKALVDQIGAGLVHEEIKPKVCVLTVDESQVQLLVRQVESLFSTRARNHYARGDAKIAAALGEFGRELRAVHPDAAPPAVTGIDQARIARSIEPMVHANVSYRGELPIKGFFERIQASRQIVFFVVGLLSLVGAGAVAKYPPVIMVTLALFSIMLFKKARDFREEAADARERELQRLVELLRTQLRQLLQELEGVNLGAWREHLQEQRKILAGALDQAARDGAAAQAREADDERQKGQLKLRALDKLLRDLAALEQRLQAMLGGVRQSRAKAELAFGQALRV
jgi:hypothetical protein